MGSAPDGILHVSDGNPKLLGTNCDNYDFNAYYDRPDDKWNQDNGFAFLSSQLSFFSPYF